jgi:uncharacterized protein YraI
MCRAWRLGRAARLAFALMLIGMAAMLAACAEPATATAQVKLRKTPGSDGAVVVLIPKGSAVKVSKCSNGWCRVSWQGQEGYALAKSFRVAGRTAGAADGEQPDDQDDQDDRNDSEESRD